VRASLTAAFCAVGLAACGGGAEDDPTSTITTTTSSTERTSTTAESTTAETTTTADADEPEPAGAADPIAAANAVLTSEGTPEQACERFVTPRFIETAYGGRENCIASRAESALAQGLALGPAVEENANHLVVIPQGGPYDGVKVEIDLVRDAGGFRVDALEADVPPGP
jgi:hypothetical protein